tara:strand:- start:174 stop:884 length:711 start_codon:yes stop_codon:yes gene_type:complete
MILETDDIIKNINPSEGVDISTYIPDLMPQQYFLFKEGGPHFFSKCKDKSVVRDIYLQNIWPFVYNIKGKGNKILTGSISKAKLSYPILKLNHKSDTIKKRNFRKITEVEIKTFPRTLEITMHKIVALAFVENSNPGEYVVVDHVDGNKVDYRLSNLRWTSLKGNSKGSAGEKSDPDIVYKLMSEQLWFQGKGPNTVKTAKDKHLEFIINGGQTEYQQQLSLKEKFEKELLTNETQ